MLEFYRKRLIWGLMGVLLAFAILFVLSLRFLQLGIPLFGIGVDSTVENIIIMILSILSMIKVIHEIHRIE